MSQLSPRWRLSVLIPGVFTLGIALSISAQPTNGVLTNFLQITRAMTNEQGVSYPVRAEAVVCSVTPETGKVFLQHELGITEAHLGVLDQPVQAGQRVLLIGQASMGQQSLSFERQPLVNNDGNHGLQERSGSIYLPVGRHPLSLAWFNGTGGRGLSVFYEGPGLRRQKIPASALFCEEFDPQTKRTNLVSGLHYKYAEGDWPTVPDFLKIPIVQTGRVGNFDISITKATNLVALEFTGYLEIAREGLYTFWTSSDDGSKFFISPRGESHLQLISSGPPPKPHLITISQILLPEEEHQWSEVEGIVTYVSKLSSGTELELSSGSGRMRVHVIDDLDNSVFLLLNSRIRARGIPGGTYTTERQKVAGEFWALNWKDIQQLEIAGHHWLSRPLTPIELLVVSNSPIPSGEIVHVQGIIDSVGANASPFIADETARIRFEGLQLPPSASGNKVELLTKFVRSETDLFLSGGQYRDVINTTNGKLSLPLLTNVKEVQSLKREQAGLHYPVRIRGVVTSRLSSISSFVLQDATHGIFVHGPSAAGLKLPAVGDYCEVEGISEVGDFAPVITASKVVNLGSGCLPEPMHPTRDQLFNGTVDSQYAELQGIVTRIHPDGLTLLTLGGKLKIEYFTSQEVLRPLENALIRLRGCLYSLWDNQTHQVRIGVVRIRDARINIDDPAPLDPFTAPLKTAQELLLFDAEASAFKRVKVQGQIVHRRAGEFYLMEGTNGIRFLPRDNHAFKVGERVEVVGFPELGGASPTLREAVVRKLGPAALPTALRLTSDTLLRADHDSTLVQIESRLISLRSNETDQVLEMQAGPRTYLARLHTNFGSVPKMPLGSKLNLTGVFAGLGGDRAEGREIDSFELLLNSPADIQILEQPSWWTPQRTLMALGTLLGILILAIAWITGLRRQVEQRTRELKGEIAEHELTEAKLAAEIAERKQTQCELEEKKISLEKEIEERKRMEAEVEQVHKKLVDASHQAGMAEVATSVLHNVGNVLNSVNVSATVVAQRLQRSKLLNLGRLTDLILENAQEPGFLINHEKGRMVPGFLKNLNETWLAEQKVNLEELESLQKNVDHIKSIVSMQQNYAKITGVLEKVKVSELLEDAIRINSTGLARHSVKLECELAVDPELVIEKHKVLQILVNLIQNAKQACSGGEDGEKKVKVKVLQDEIGVQIKVIDNGMGIPPENMKRLFTQGFTTRKDGHGFGLHSSINAAREMNGTLRAESEGVGKGAVFTLELPWQGLNQPIAA